MRQITVDFEKKTISGLIDNKYAGYLGEHNATELVINKPADLIGVQYSLAFMTNGEVVHSKYFSDNEPIKVSMWQQITQDSTVYVQLEAYDENGDYLGKSSVAKLNLGNSVQGVDVIADTDNPDVYSEIALNSWFRETLEDNANTLDKLSTSEDGKLLFDGKSVGGTSGEEISDELYEEIKENTENRHWHDNKYTLDKFTKSTTSVRPMYDGENVAMQRDIPTSVSNVDFNNYLNNDYDESKIPNWKNHISIENVDQLIEHLYEKFATKDVVSALGNPLTVSVVEVLPETGEANVVYLVPNGDGTHNEYLFVDSVAELIGSTDINLTDYAKTEDIPTKTSQLENDSGFITKADIPTDESYEPVGQTPLTLENGGNIKLVADGETSYSIVSPTVWSFDDAELTLSNVEMSTDEGYYKFTVNNEDTHHWKHNISFVVSGLEIGRKYKFIFDVSNRTYDTASKTGYGAFQIYSGSAVAGTPITTHYPKNSNICEFTAPNTSVAIRWIVPIGSAPYLGWVLNFNKLYLNYAEMSDKLVEKYNNSGTFTDVEAFKSIPSGVYITTDPTASVYRKTPTDKTLTQSDVPADAEATGKEISVLKSCLPLYGKTIVNFGDSIFANGYPSNDISTFLSEKTGATVYNCGFGGCTMFDNNPFSMCNLATAIATKDFAAAENDLATTNRPEYFATNIEKLKTIDFSKVDIVTVSYGTNDFMADTNIENGENAYDKATICGALRHSVETLLTAYPNLRIFVLSLTYRFYIDENNEFVEDSNTYTNGNGDTIPDVNAKLAETAKEYNLPFIDDYNIGIGKFNRYQYFPETDGTHQKIEGRRLIASHLAKELY